ncbi:MAG: gliding motility-associated C-terminal domain-containing protein [Saprospiraceae bacterium]
MKKLIFLITIGLICFNSYSQVFLKLSSVTGNKGDNVAIELRVDNFTKLQSTQFSISYDSLLMEYINITDLPAAYANISLSEPNVPPGRKGIINTTWNDPNSETTTFPSNALLFKINFKLIGNPCDSNLIRITPGKVPSGSMVPIEIIDENTMSVPFTLIDGKVKINGPNCKTNPGGGGDSTFTFVVSKEMVSKGSNGCVKITCKNFNKINSFQGAVKWDKLIARYTGISANKITMFSENGNTNITTDSTTLKFFWDSPPNPATGLTLPDNSVLFEVCFDAVGAVNSITDVNIVDAPNIPIEVTAGGTISDVVPYKIEIGSYKVIGAQNILNLYTRDTSGTIGSEVCIPVYVNNYTCIEAFQFALKYDKTKLTYTRVSSGGVTINASNVFVVADSVRLQFDNNGTQQNLPNGAVLLNICFTLTGPCDMTVPFEFVPLSVNGPIEFSGCNDPVTVKTTNSKITINCANTPVTIIIKSHTDVSCFGSCDGTIATDVSGGSGNFTFSWINVATGLPVVPAITTKDATGLCAGQYRLRVLDIGVTPNTTTNSVTVTIVDGIPIVITAQISNVTQAGGDGMIQLFVTGGTPGYRYKWFRLPQTNLPDTTDEISRKNCGNYRVSVTDSKGCIGLDTFRIECYTPDPTCTTTILDSLKCSGDCNGSLRAEVVGGTIQYKFRWSTGDSTISIKNLCSGTYTYTLTDSKGLMCTSSYTFVDPTKIKITVTDSTCSNGSDGSVKVSITGGSSVYTNFEWKVLPAQSVFSTTQNLMNAPPGQYVLKVTDSKGCTASYTTTVGSCNTPVELKVTVVADIKNGGAGTSCFGVCDGKIIATAVSGKLPYTYKWSHNANLNSNIADNLCAGNYTVTVTDANNKTATATIRINDATGLTLNIKKKSCASSSSTNDGSYEAVVSGGSKPYTYQWCSNETGSVSTRLESGLCSVTVTDNNGCTKKEIFTVCIETDPAGDCFSSRLAISPNADGVNDNFEISCILNYQNTLHIYTRWGKLVYSAIDYVNQWTGVDLEGNELKEGTYMYVLVIKEPGKNDDVHKGTVTLVR